MDQNEFVLIDFDPFLPQIILYVENYDLVGQNDFGLLQKRFFRSEKYLANEWIKICTADNF